MYGFEVNESPLVEGDSYFGIFASQIYMLFT